MAGDGDGDGDGDDDDDDDDDEDEFKLMNDGSWMTTPGPPQQASHRPLWPYDLLASRFWKKATNYLFLSFVWHFFVAATCHMAIYLAPGLSVFCHLRCRFFVIWVVVSL